MFVLLAFSMKLNTVQKIRLLRPFENKSGMTNGSTKQSCISTVLSVLNDRSENLKPYKTRVVLISVFTIGGEYSKLNHNPT